MLNSRDLADLRPDVRVNVETLLRLCEEQGLHVLVTQTKRDNEYQNYLYQQGRTRPGSIITMSSTTTFHGAGLAFDICKDVKGHEYDDESFFLNVAIIAKELGFSWGGDWVTFVDKPHFQWDNRGKYSTVMLRAGYPAPYMPDWEAHMEVKQFIEALTPEEAFRIAQKAEEYAVKRPLPSNWDAAGQLERAKEMGITDGSRPMASVTRLEAAVMAMRARGGDKSAD